uniref:WD_REPEATS_REGION domain-containing protein n=1 Tax=Gongylonema pulchrum TaxID=637853 RepID=A0A183DLP2_9BILA
LALFNVSNGFSSDNTFVTDRCVGKDDKLAVNAVAFYCCPKKGPLIFAGRKDGSIAVYVENKPEPIRVMHQHESNG